MSQAKARVLEGTDVHIRELLASVHLDAISETVDLIEELQKKYHIIDKEYRTWPFNLPELRRFGITAVSCRFSLLWFLFWSMSIVDDIVPVLTMFSLLSFGHGMSYIRPLSPSRSA
jgi:hypothetical protein